MQIDLLYFDGCPSWQTGLQNLMIALEADGLKADIHLVPVESDEDAARLKFLGSPSYQVGGVDWWLDQRDGYNLSCRVYRTSQGLKGAPTVDMLREKIRSQSAMEGA